MKKSFREYFKNFSVYNCVIGIIISLLCLSLVVPIAYAFLTSFKTIANFRANPLGLPSPFTFENYAVSYDYFYVQVTTAAKITKIKLPQLIFNTLAYSLGCATMSAITPCVMAYLSARFKCKFSTVIYSTVLVCMVVPIVGSLPAEIAMARSLGIYDTIWGLMIMRTNFLGMYFLVFHASVKGLPNAYSEAAKIDGAGNFSIFFKIYLPLLRNILFTVFLIQFINYWNEYETPLIYMPTHPTLSYALNELVVENRETKMSWDVRKLAAAMIVFVPIFTIFVIFNKRIIGNVTLGGIKG